MENVTLTEVVNRLSAAEQQIAQLSTRLEAYETARVPAGSPRDDVWVTTLRHLQHVLSEVEFRAFFRRTVLVRDEGYRLIVKAVGAEFVNEICRRYGDAVDQALAAIGRPNTTVVFTADHPEPDLP